MATTGGANLSQQASKRLLIELRQYTTDPRSSEDWFLQTLAPLNEGDLSRWKAVIRGVPNTIYESGIWSLDIEIPGGYPSTPPKVKFREKCCHLNVDYHVGSIRSRDSPSGLERG